MKGSPSFAHLLERHLSRNSRSPIWLAAQLDINPETVAGWLSGSIYPDNQEIISQILEVLEIIDKAEQENLRRPGTGMASMETVRFHQTNFHGPVYGPVHTGTGDINVNPLSLTALQEWLAAVFHWSEAPEHMQSSWAGMVIWSLTAVTNRLTPQRWLAFLAAVILWIGTAWLITPLLQWPLADPQNRLLAAIQYAAASLIIPLLVGSVSTADNQALFSLQTGKDSRLLWFLKVTGALVGFNVFCALLLGISLGLYYLTVSTLPSWGWWLLLLIPLLFAYVVARRIPADRYKMFGGELRSHDADRLFFVVFLLFGPFLAGFVHLFYPFLSERITGFVFLLVILGIALWEQRRRTPDALSDQKTILALGLFLPLAILLLYLFFSDQFNPAFLSTSKQRLFTLLAFAYVVGPIILWITLAVRNKPVLTLKGVIGLLVVTAVLNLILLQNLVVGRWLTLAVLALWGAAGKRYVRNYFLIHDSFLLMLIGVGLSYYLVVHTAVPLWANFLGFTLLTITLTYWAYQKDIPSI